MDWRGRWGRREFLRGLTAGGATAVAAPVLGAVLDACAGEGPAVTTGGTVSFAISTEPKVLSPPVHTLAIESTVMSAIFAGLVRMRADGSIEPDLAESYRVEDGGMTYRFRLRDGLRWPDGRPLTSRDVLFTYQTYVDPRTRTSYLVGWDRVDRVETPDAATAVFRMKEVFAPFLIAVGGNPVLPEHVLARSQDIRKDPFNRAPVGAGPFTLRDWQTASQIVLEANPHYWRGRPRLDRLVFKVVPDAATQLNQLQAGEVDIIAVAEAAQWDQVRSMAPRVTTSSYDDTRYVLVQLDEYVFLKDLAVRQALDHATPKRDIVQGVLRGLATPGYADVPPGSPYFLAQVEHHDYSPDRARALLQQAGFTLRDGVMTRDGQALEVPIYTIASSPTFVQVAQVLKEAWSRVGVRTDVTTMDASTLFSNQGPQWNGRDAALIFSWAQGVDPYNYVNWSSTQIPNGEDDPGENAERYANPVMDELVVRGGAIADPAQRRPIYDQIQQVLAHDVPVLFLYWPKALYACGARVRGFRPNAFGGVLDGVWIWSRTGP
jgi:peptide/nickel transport system substrate-binding protein